MQARGAERPHRLIYFLPENVMLGPQIEARFRALGLSVATLRGRGDPFAPPNRARPPLCDNLEAIREARRVGASPGQTVCRNGDETAPCYAACRYFESVRAAAAADVVIAANNFLFEPMPKSVRENVGWVVIDEAFADRGDSIRSITLETFSKASLDRFPVLSKGEPHEGKTRRLGWLNEMLMQACNASPDDYLSTAVAAVRAAGLSAEQAEEASSLSWRRKVAVDMKPGMTLEARREAAQRAAINGMLPTIGAIWRAIAATLRGDERGAGRLKLTTTHTKKGTIRELVVLGQRQIADWINELPVLMLNATGGIEEARRFFPRAVERTPTRVATPHVRTRLILGGFGKSTLARSPRKLHDLRAYLSVEYPGQAHGIATHLAAVEAFKELENTRLTHFGATAGDDEFRNVDVMSVIGGPSAKPDDIAELGAARTGQPVPVARAVPSTAPVLMTDGTGVAVPVLAYEHPAAQAVHETIFNGSINQAIARPRQVMRTAANPVTINIFANVAPNVPVDEIVHWRDIRPDRLTHMVARRRVFLNAASMAQHHPELFRSEKAAAAARARFGDIFGRLRDMLSRSPESWSRVRLQRPGQGCKLEFAVCPTAELEALRAEIETEAGELVHWQSEIFAKPARPEDIPKPEIRPLSNAGMSSALGGWIPPQAWADQPIVRPRAPPDG